MTNFSYNRCIRCDDITNHLNQICDYCKEIELRHQEIIKQAFKDFDKEEVLHYWDEEYVKSL